MAKKEKLAKNIDKSSFTAAQKPEEKPEKKTKVLPQYYSAVGRRKQSSARVRLYTVKGSSIQLHNKEIKAGEMIINNRPIESYFAGEFLQKKYMEPFRTTNTVGRFAVTSQILGGGAMGQLLAFIHGVSRALVKVDEEKNKPLLRKGGFMTRDPRKKQRRMAGFAQKSRAKKQSPKR